MTVDEREFENEVRRVARSLWPSAQYQGAVRADDRERDGLFITDECVHLLECTTSRKQDKAREDVQKLVKLAGQMKIPYPTKAVKCWFVTQDEPTADQRAVVDRHAGLVVAISLDQFRSKLVDASGYIECRKNYRFGSMQDFDTPGARTPFHFVELDILSDSGERHSIPDIVNVLSSGRRFLLLGDYGAGKSTTLREVFLAMQKAFFLNKIRKFPILLNLRDHYAQTNAAEALERHARRVGYDPAAHLVKAWRAGYAVILLDGFDEIATPGWSGQASRLKKLRFDSMQLIRDFIRGTPAQSGCAIAGRTNFFDSPAEMTSALGATGFTVLSLNDFTEEQVTDYLHKKGWDQGIPSWFPTRPLLLGYLAATVL